MCQVVRRVLIGSALLVLVTPSFAETVPTPGTIQLSRILVSTFEPMDDLESSGVFAIRMWPGSRGKGPCNQDQRVLIVVVPEHFELHRRAAELRLLSRMGSYLDNTCGKDSEGFRLFVSKSDITNTEADRNKNGLSAQYLDHRWVTVINSTRNRQRPARE